MIKISFISQIFNKNMQNKNMNLIGIKTIKWILKDFTLTSTLKIFRYYFKKKLRLLDYKKVFFITFKFNNKKVKFLLRENNDDFAIIREIFLLKAYKTKFRNIKTIVDAGAHIGASAIYFSLIFPGCKVICIEPSKENLKLLKKNLEINNVNYLIIDKALSGIRKPVGFAYNVKNPAYSHISKKNHNSVEIVESITLDTILKIVKNIDLLKLDIEGEEINVLKKLKKEQAKKIKRIIMEVHYRKYDIKKLIKIMKNKGFKLLPKMAHWKELNQEIEYPFLIFEK